MLSTLFFALLPIVVTIGIGVLAARAGNFTAHDSEQLTQLVLRYALPMSTFAGILPTPRKVILADLPLLWWILIGMVGTYLVLLVGMRGVAHVNRPVAILRSMAIAAPSVPFIGSAVLPLLFTPSVAAIDIGVSSLLMNAILVPLVFWQLAAGSTDEVSLGRRIVNTLKQPLVFAALLAFILALCGVKMPARLAPTFTTLGGAAGGLAMFATGIILYNSKIKLSKQIAANVLLRNVAIPVVIWGLMLLFKLPSELIRLTVVTVAIPSAAIPTILAIRYKTNEDEIAATQFYSTVLALVTLSGFMLLLS